MKLLSLLLLLLISPILSAQNYSQGSSQWCLIRDEIEICNYASPEICYDAALQVGGYCRENSRRAGAKGDWEWCVISSNGRNCNFASQEACINAARRIDSDGIRSGCVYNIELKQQKSIDRNDALGFALQEELEESGQDNLADQLRDAQSESKAQQELAEAPGAGE